MDPNAIGGEFTAAAQAYANGIQPYATKLFAALLFIEILVTAIQYMTPQGDAFRYIGRLFRHLFSAGFIYLMLINAFPWMTGVMKLFRDWRCRQWSSEPQPQHSSRSWRSNG